MIRKKAARSGFFRFDALDARAALPVVSRLSDPVGFRASRIWHFFWTFPFGGVSGV